jgi:hypothetical protein
MIQSFAKFTNATYLQPTRIKIVIPAFTLDIPTWANASQLLAEFPVGNTDYYFSLKLPTPAFGSEFICAIRWKLDDICSRFKLWNDTLGILYFPIYSGERIGLNAIIEIWSIDSNDAPTLSADKTLYSSQIVFPDSYCDTCEIPSETITLVQTAASPLPPYANCNPFCDNLC